MSSEPVARGHLVVVGGTWEHTAFGLLGDVVARTNNLWQAHWVKYPASFGTPEAYDESLADGVEALVTLLLSLPADRPLAVVGYSQGAAIVEKAMRQLQHSRMLSAIGVLTRIRYVGTVASPYRSRRDQVGLDPGGFGISGPLPEFQPPIGALTVWEQFALPGDLICACPVNSLVRFVEPLTPAMSAKDPARWARDVRAKLTLTFLYAHFPELWDWRRIPTLLGRIREAGEQLAAYQQTGIHMQYARTRIPGQTLTATEWIARELNEIGWKS